MSFDDISQEDVLLVTGEATDNPYELLIRLLAAKSDGAIIITLDKGVTQILSVFDEVIGEHQFGQLVIIDCSDSDHPEDLQEGVSVIPVESTTNLTRIGVEFTNAFGSMHDDPEIDHIGVGFQSISRLIKDIEIKSVYQFFQVLTGQIRTANAFGVAVLETDNTEMDDDYRMLYHHFDGVLHLRQSPDGTSEYQKRGLDPQWSEWKSI